MTYFSADEVNEICDRMRAEHYPCDVIHLDTGWFKTDWLCEWKFNEERFPDPKGFIQGLKKKGYRVSLWQLPYVAENAEQIDEARKNDYIAPLTSYVARHAWASIARSKNIPLATISEAMGHDSESTTRIYLARMLKPMA